MKALTVRQPWAQAIVLGHKTVENRTWRTTKRGRVYVHAAAKRPRPADIADCSWLVGHTYDNMPLGQIIGSVRIVDCVPWKDVVDNVWATDAGWCWLLADAELDVRPGGMRGQLGFWTP